MDFVDKVYIDLKDREPSNFLMSSLKDPEKFISAVKFLIDGGWLTNVHWDSGYNTIYIEEKFPFKSDKNAHLKPRPTTWYDYQNLSINTQTNE